MHNDKKKIINNTKLPKSIRSIARMYPSNRVNRLNNVGLNSLKITLIDI